MRYILHLLFKDKHNIKLKSITIGIDFPKAIKIAFGKFLLLKTKVTSFQLR